MREVFFFSSFFFLLILLPFSFWERKWREKRIKEFAFWRIKEICKNIVFFSNAFLGTMDNNMKKELCIRTVEELKSLYGKKLRGAIFHSDRGGQYTSEAFKNALQKAGLCQSLSGTGHCFDNARMESFFATLKKEKIYQISAYKLTREQVKTIIFRYIFVYYNRIRITSFNPGGLAPVAYREWARSTLTCAA